LFNEKRKKMRGSRVSASIREALRNAGYNQRMVSVRSRRGGYESSITVEILSPNVNFRQVEEIANGFERVDRCQVSGEILAGGNVFVHVELSSAVIAQLAAPYVEAAQAAVEEIQNLAASM
jgi:hypothetical protein